MNTFIIEHYSPINRLNDFLLSSTFALLQSQTKCSYGGRYSVLRLSLQYVIWWWQFKCNEGWTPLSTIKFGWSVNIKSIQEEVCGSRWVGCDISWWNPYTLVRDSSCVPSIVVLSLVHQTEDLALKSPKIMVNKELQKVVSLKTFSNFDKKFSNSKIF